MSFTPSIDLKTLLDAHTFADNANLSGEPFIKLIDDGTQLVDGATNRPIHPLNGIITIGEENLINTTEWTNHRNEDYRLLVDANFGGQTTGTKLKALLTEIQNVFDTENKTVDRGYYWKMNYTWSGLVQEGSINVIIDAQKQWVVI